MGLFAYFELMRPLNCVMAGLAAVLGYSLAAGGVFLNEGTLALFSVAFLVCGGGQAVNDFFDKEIDARFKRSRPIPSGRVHAVTALVFSINLFLLGSAFAFLFLPRISLAISLVYSVLLIAYAAVLSRVKYLGNWLVAAGTGLTYLFGASASGDYLLAGILAASAVASNVGREVAKDLEDLPADRGAKTTLPMIAGKKVSETISAIFYVLSVPSVLLPAFLPGIANSFPALIPLLSANAINLLPLFLKPVFLVLIAVACALLLRSAWLVLEAEYGLSQKMAKAGMALALVAYFTALLT